ncbi:hypothetical protein GLAREA_10279 [Glarea lozoyensis ATCC 20868]|uniref:Uncharacterized protein n=1 Tax=Glarea lozoyensis (strain ATCC 20868 / MF5171) TaxID=1116229 RepID=S3DA01_GLAL2|nr:uncharacterized protein GLAREA_10279 [Glarea lozoyensis ATCC 20868]EPE34585.1 hypothetical protein GLAREA_10279 [Glarea lozoyensis ATCC 20868]
MSRSSSSVETPSWHCLLLLPIFDTLCSFLEPRDLISFFGTTKACRDLYPTLLTSQFNINRLLKRFVKTPVALRSELAKHNAVISGSTALQLFERVTWRKSDLDIYVERDDGTAVSALGTYLTTVESYVAVAAPFPNANDDYGLINLSIKRIDNFQKVDGNGVKLKVQIMSTRTLALEAIVANYYTTAVVNFITWNAAYCLFPDLTFIKRTTYSLKNTEERYNHQIAKYRDRGWETLGVVEDEDQQFTKSLLLHDDEQGFRRIGDSRTWKIDLDTAGVTPGAPSTSVEYCLFNLRTVPVMAELNENSHYKIDTSVFVSCILKYKYLRDEKVLVDGSLNFWPQHANHFNELTRIEMNKLEPDDRPWDLDSVDPQAYFLSARVVQKNPPTGWTFYDAEIPKLFATWQNRGLPDLSSLAIE